jgi:hypothetical protein
MNNKMQIFIQEPDDQQSCNVILLLNKKEAKQLYEAFEIAVKAEPRKKSIKNILNELDKKLAIF